MFGVSLVLDVCPIFDGSSIFDDDCLVCDVSLINDIRHRAEGRSGVTSAVESFIHSFSSTSFQVEPPASGLRGSRWSSGLHLVMFLEGGHGVSLRLRAWIPPPLWRPFSPSCLILALLGAILAHLGALRPHLVAKLLQDGAHMPNIAPRWANMASKRAPSSKKKFQK